MSTKIQKWGNSLAVRLPRNIVKKMHLEAGTRVVVEEEQGQVIKIMPDKKFKYTLEELVDKITEENRHEFIDPGEPVGNEIWW